jgi:hypothetical protein
MAPGFVAPCSGAPPYRSEPHQYKISAKAIYKEILKKKLLKSSNKMHRVRHKIDKNFTRKVEVGKPCISIPERYLREPKQSTQPSN